MNLKKTNTLVWTLSIVAAIIYFIGMSISSNIMVWIAVLLMIATVIVSIRYWRCPNCDKHLGRLEGSYCQHCGKKIDK